MANWFENWFDSPYYDLLYKKRDENEAAQFIHELLNNPTFQGINNVLDVGCGTGRHAIPFVERSIEYTGVDLSTRSIDLARGRGLPNASYHVADMRYFKLPQFFDLAVNLFTSFGYFETKAEHLQVLKNIYQHLRPNGYFVLDFMNVQTTIAHLVKSENKTVNGIEFQITRALKGNQIVKTICFHAKGQEHRFQERVWALDAHTITDWLNESGFKVIQLAGDYSWRNFDPENSTRLIVLSSRLP